MTRLHDLHTEQGQSPWLDNLRRGWITSGQLERWVENGVRGLTSNPSIFQKAIAGSEAYDHEFRDAISSGASVEDSYWRLVTSDIEAALAILRPVYDSSDGRDGYVSVEVDPGLARDTAGTETAARALWDSIDEPNLYVKIPGTAEGLPAIEQMISEKRNINVTLLFALDRYRDVMEAYISGLERADGDLSRVSSVASFFISRVDTAVDRALDAVGTPEAAALRGKTAIANGKLAYAAFLETFRGPRWEALVERGARVQRPLWASTSTKDPSFPDTLYVDTLIGPDTVNTIPDATLEAFIDHGTVRRSIDADVDQARAVVDGLAAVGVDLVGVTDQLEAEGVASFEKAFTELIGTLADKARLLG
ncbi:MAG: transaldolase [Acidimicrobiia bacterium]|nr:transaldolase [Acidimicrobiia bacterium]